MSHNQTELLKKSLAERILILDGAMGTMIQKYKLTEADFRGERFKESAVDSASVIWILIQSRDKSPGEEDIWMALSPFVQESA